MSFAAEGWAYGQQCGSGIAKAVLAYLGFRAGRHTGLAWPSVGTMVRELEFTERAIRKALDELVKLGLVEREHRHAANGRCLSSLYRLPGAALRGAEPTPAETQETPGGPTPANPQEKPSREDSNPKREEEDTRARRAPVSSLHPHRTKKAEGVGCSTRVPIPEGFELPPELARAIREAGHDPTELVDEVRDWANRVGAKSSNWHRTTLHFARRTPPPRKRRSSQAGNRQPDYHERAEQVASGHIAALRELVGAGERL